MNVLYWIRGKGRQFRPFVANRIGVIQSHTDPEQWQHIDTKEIPQTRVPEELGPEN